MASDPVAGGVPGRVQVVVGPDRGVASAGRVALRLVSPPGSMPRCGARPMTVTVLRGGLGWAADAFGGTVAIGGAGPVGIESAAGGCGGGEGRTGAGADATGTPELDGVSPC